MPKPYSLDLRERVVSCKRWLDRTYRGVVLGR